MTSKNQEFRLILRILSIIGALLIVIAIGAYVFLKIEAPHLLNFSKSIEEYRITVALDTLNGARFIDGMTGCENLVLADEGLGLYVSCLDGYLHYLDGNSTQDIKVRKSVKSGSRIMGLAQGKGGMLYAAVCSGEPDEWVDRGGGIFRFSRDLDLFERVTSDYPAINGMTCDSSANIYFASSNFNFIHPEGWVYRMTTSPEQPLSTPELIFHDAGLSNGLYYDQYSDEIFYSNTIVGIYKFTPGHPGLTEVYLKLRFMEACDDLCTDRSGMVWMTDPGYSTVKMYDPSARVLVRFIIKNIGQTSSCRIRTEEGEDMLYVTELKIAQKTMSRVYDGRGVLVVPVRSLLRLMESTLANQPKS